MKVKTVNDECKSLNYLTVGYDVSKYKHNYYARFQSANQTFEIEGELTNNIAAINKHFDELKEIQDSYNFDAIQIAFEPTGGYEKTLLRLARKNSILCSYVNSEASSKSKVIESNDASKTDVKDARIINMLASQRKVLTCRLESDIYGRLKFYNSRYEEYSRAQAQKKNHISTLIDVHFPELRITDKQRYAKVVLLIVNHFALNPYLIAELSLDSFLEELEMKDDRRLHPTAIKLATKIWESSCRQYLMDVELWRIEAYAEDLKLAYADYLRIAERKEKYKSLMQELAVETPEYQKVQAAKIGLFMFSRIIAETGAWQGFAGYRQLLRFAGLNLREKQSGTFKGHVKLSKKGNSLLRKCLGQLCYSNLIKKDEIYGEYYQKKKEQANGFYALACVMRKSLKMLFGIYKSEANFERQRIFNQEIKTTENAA